MKSKIGELHGRPLIVTANTNEVKYPELLVTTNANSNKITDIKEREGDELISLLDIDNSNSGGVSSAVQISFNFGTTVGEAGSIYYFLDNSTYIHDYNIATFSDNPRIQVFNPNKEEAIINISPSYKGTISFYTLDENHIPESLEYIQKVISTIDPDILEDPEDTSDMESNPEIKEYSNSPAGDKLVEVKVAIKYPSKLYFNFYNT